MKLYVSSGNNYNF